MNALKQIFGLAVSLSGATSLLPNWQSIPKEKMLRDVSSLRTFSFASEAAVYTQQCPEMMLENCTKNMWKVMISSLNLLKTEVEMKQGKAGEASSLMITHQVYKMCADCLIAKVLN